MFFPETCFAYPISELNFTVCNAFTGRQLLILWHLQTLWQPIDSDELLTAWREIDDRTAVPQEPKISVLKFQARSWSWSLISILFCRWWYVEVMKFHSCQDSEARFDLGIEVLVKPWWLVVILNMKFYQDFLIKCSNLWNDLKKLLWYDQFDHPTLGSVVPFTLFKCNQKWIHPSIQI